MARIARWEPVEPVSPVRRAWDALAARQVELVLPLVFAAFMTRLFAVVAERHGAPGWTGGAIAFLFALYVWFVTRAMGGKPGSRRLRAELRDVRKGEAFPVLVRLFRDDVAYGQDEGIVWFEGGALRFDGLATAFRLRPEDASLLPDAFAVEPGLLGTPESPYGSLHARAAWGFDLAAEPGVRLAFDPIAEPGFGSIHDALFHWLFQPPEATGETILPPLVPLWGYRAPKTIRFHRENRRG